MGKDGRLYVRLSEEQKERWIKAAKRDGFFNYGEINLSAWLRTAGDEKATRGKQKR
jgi:tRNA splicing ligase